MPTSEYFSRTSLALAKTMATHEQLMGWRRIDRAKVSNNAFNP
jgi:hypothetical protein